MKEVMVKHYSALYFDVAEVGWEDLWLRVHQRRKILSLAPCLNSYDCILSDISLREGSKSKRKSSIQWNNEQLERLHRIKGIVEKEDLYVDAAPITPANPGKNFIFSDIYTKRNMINKAEANKMIEFYLSKLGMKNLKIRWQRPKFTITPVML